MQRYRDIDHDSGVFEFEIGDTFIRVRFKDGSIYGYSYASAGSNHVNQMKILATNGEGLNAYINKFVRRRHDRSL